MPPPRRKLLEQHPKLVERYMRLAIFRKTKLITLSWARCISRPRLQWNDRKRNRVLAATLRTVAIEAARARRLNFEANTSVLNLGLYFLIAERDIQAVKIDALTHPDAWQRGIASRVMLLTIHELDLDKVGGNKLRQALDDSNAPEELRQMVTEAMRTIRKAQARAQRQFAYLRNSTIAHRDPDAIRQYRDIVAIDGYEVTKIAAEFYEGTEKFMNVLPLLLTYLSTWPGLIGQQVAQAKRNK